MSSIQPRELTSEDFQRRVRFEGINEAAAVHRDHSPGGFLTLVEGTLAGLKLVWDLGHDDPTTQAVFVGDAWWYVYGTVAVLT